MKNRAKLLIIPIKSVQIAPLKVHKLIGKELTERVALLMEAVSLQVYRFVCRGLFERHKMIFSSMFLFRVLEQQSQGFVVTRAAVDQLIAMTPSSDSGNNAAAAAIPDSVKAYISESQWFQIKGLEESLPLIFKASTNTSLSFSFEQDYIAWRRWLTLEKAEKHDLPRAFRDLNQFYKLMLLRILRPDRIQAALKAFIEESLGSNYNCEGGRQGELDLGQVLDETSPSTPLFFVLFPGQDPAPQLELLGREWGVTVHNGRFVNISMGQGQEDVGGGCFVFVCVIWRMGSNGVTRGSRGPPVGAK